MNTQRLIDAELKDEAYARKELSKILKGMRFKKGSIREQKAVAKKLTAAKVDLKAAARNAAELMSDEPKEQKRIAKKLVFAANALNDKDKAALAYEYSKPKLSKSDLDMFNTIAGPKPLWDPEMYVKYKALFGATPEERKKIVADMGITDDMATLYTMDERPLTRAELLAADEAADEELARWRDDSKYDAPERKPLQPDGGDSKREGTVSSVDDLLAALETGDVPPPVPPYPDRAPTPPPFDFDEVKMLTTEAPKIERAVVRQRGPKRPAPKRPAPKREAALSADIDIPIAPDFDPSIFEAGPAPKRAAKAEAKLSGDLADLLREAQTRLRAPKRAPKPEPKAEAKAPSPALAAALARAARTSRGSDEGPPDDEWDTALEREARARIRAPRPAKAAPADPYAARRPSKRESKAPAKAPAEPDPSTDEGWRDILSFIAEQRRSGLGMNMDDDFGAALKSKRRAKPKSKAKPKRKAKTPARKRK